MLDWKGKKTTKHTRLSPVSMLSSSNFTSCRRTDREPVPVANQLEDNDDFNNDDHAKTSHQ